MATNYADEDAVLVELKKYGEDGTNVLTPEVLDRILSKADQMVNRKLVNIEIPEPIPDEIQEAATLYAVARGYDIFMAEQDNRNPTARQNDTDADGILEGYIAEHPQEATGIKITSFNVDSSLNES